MSLRLDEQRRFWLPFKHRIYNLSSLKVEIITPDGEAIAAAQQVLAQMRCAIDGNAIGAAKIIDGKLPISLVFYLSMIARNTFVFNNDIIRELAPNVDNGFFDAVDLLARLR